MKNTWTLRVHKPESVTPSILGLNLYPFIDREPMVCLGRGVYGSGYELGLRYPRGTRKKSKARYCKCGQAPGLKNKRIFLSDGPPNKYISPKFCFLSSRSWGNRNKDSISLWAGRQLLRGIYGLAAVRPPGRARRGTGS